MPIYEYRCDCGEEFEQFENISENHENSICKCGQVAARIWSAPCLITDTSFCMTGKRDARLDNEVIEGRSHWKKKLKEKGYMELSQHQVKNMD